MDLTDIDYKRATFDTSVLAKERSEATPPEATTVRANSNGYSTGRMEDFMMRNGLTMARAFVYSRMLWKAGDQLTHSISLYAISVESGIRLSRVHDIKAELVRAGLLTQLTHVPRSPNVFGFCQIDEAVKRTKAFWPEQPGARRVANLSQVEPDCMISELAGDLPNTE